MSCGPGRLIANDETTSVGSSTTESGESDESTESDESESGTDDSTSLVPPGPEMLAEDCDPWLQDCPEGEKCVPYASDGGAWAGNECVPVLGDHATGEPCTFEASGSTDDCDATSFCWDGTCHGFCTGSPEMPECPEGEVCPISSDPIVTLCVPACDPVAQDCADGMACYFTGSEFLCIIAAEPPGIPPGEPCEWVNDCQPGSQCLDASLMPDCIDSLGCCGEFCDLGLGDAQCAAVPGTSCVSFYEEGTAPANLEHVGVCVLAP